MTMGTAGNQRFPSIFRENSSLIATGISNDLKDVFAAPIAIARYGGETRVIVFPAVLSLHFSGSVWDIRTHQKQGPRP